MDHADQSSNTTTTLFPLLPQTHESFTFLLLGARLKSHSALSFQDIKLQSSSSSLFDACGLVLPLAEGALFGVNDGFGGSVLLQFPDEFQELTIRVWS